MTPGDIDHRVRMAAFRFLEEQTQLRGETLTRDVLAKGFGFEDRLAVHRSVVGAPFRRMSAEV